MRTVDFIKMTVGIMTMAISLTACNNEVVYDEAVDRNDNMVEVSLKCKGEDQEMEYVSTSRAEESNNLFYVQVFIDMPIPKRYADGLFDNIDNLKIKLDKNQKYIFLATYIKNGKNIVYSEKDPETEKTYYYSPFYSIFNNQFSYKGTFKEYSLIFGYTVTEKLENGNMLLFNRPIQHRYYGESNVYSPAQGGDVCINMAKTSFGVDVEVENMQEGDKIWVKIAGTQNICIEYPETNISKTISFIKLKDAYDTDKQNDGTFKRTYSEKIPVSIEREDKNGKIIPVGTKEIIFKRNMSKTLKVNITDNSSVNRINMNNIMNDDRPEDNETVYFVGGLG